MKSQLYELVVWVDKGWERVEFSGKPVQSPMTLLQKDFDYVVIALTKHAVSLNAKKELIDMGIDADKIKCISKELISYDYLPLDFFE